MDLGNVMAGRPDKTVERREMLWHFPCYLEAYDTALDVGRDPLFRTRPVSALRQGRWKLLYRYEDRGHELYDLRTDKGERSNRATEFPGIAQQMLRMIESRVRGLGLALPKGGNPLYD